MLFRSATNCIVSEKKLLGENLSRSYFLLCVLRGRVNHAKIRGYVGDTKPLCRLPLFILSLKGATKDTWTTETRATKTRAARSAKTRSTETRTSKAWAATKRQRSIKGNRGRDRGRKWNRGRDREGLRDAEGAGDVDDPETATLVVAAVIVIVRVTTIIIVRAAVIIVAIVPAPSETEGSVGRGGGRVDGGGIGGLEGHGCHEGDGE